MATTVDPHDIAINLGRPLSQEEHAQASLWITWAEQTIAGRMGDTSALNQAIVDMVITEAVTARVRNPDPVSSVSVQVDDAQVSRSYARATGLIEIRPEWWAALGWVDAAGAFSTRPRYAPDR